LQLLDGNFIHCATSHKIDIWARVQKHLGGEKFAFYVPKCVITELRALGTAVEDALDFALTNCEVVEDLKGAEGAMPSSPTEAIKALIGASNPRKFLVATQESELRDHLRRMAGVPLLHIQRTVLLMEAPSSSSRRTSDHEEAQKLKGVTAGEAVAVALAAKLRLEARAEKRRADGAASAGVPLRKVKAKGPNPLSCMKKKKASAPPPLQRAGAAAGRGDDDDADEKKRRRRRKKAKDGGGDRN